jgi:hypothetical protein
MFRYCRDFDNIIGLEINIQAFIVTSFYVKHVKTLIGISLVIFTKYLKI